MPSPETIEFAFALARNARGLAALAQLRLLELVGRGLDRTTNRRRRTDRQRRA